MSEGSKYQRQMEISEFKIYENINVDGNFKDKYPTVDLWKFL